jgi:GNAT superfamily N-acetyltransferase
MMIEIVPATAERWGDLERLFGPRGACAGCWCMYWRLSRKEFERQRGAGTRAALKALVEAGHEPGLLAYVVEDEGREPAGWCALAQREQYPTLERSRVLKRLDDEPVWSVSCFFVARRYRRQGLTVALLKAAVDYARQHGARIVEGYPVEPKTTDISAPSAYTGLVSAFRQAGFREAGRHSPTRPIMRYYLHA